MGNLIVLIFIMSLISSIMFGSILLIEHIYQTKYVDYVYFTMKMVLLIYAVPIILMIHLIVMDSMKYTFININGEEIMNVSIFKIYNMGLLSHKEQIEQLVFVVWLLGVMVSYFNSFIKGKKLLKQLIRNSEEITSKEVWNILEKLKLELGIRKSPKLYKSQIINTPFLTGILKPLMIFPSKQFTEEEWEMMLRHELMHLKANDLIFKAVVGYIQSIHWFNPVVYFYRETFFDFCEYTCDKRTTVFFSNEQRSQYAMLIVRLAAIEPEYKQVVALVDKNYKVIERRVKEIMRVPKKEKSALLIGTFAAFMVVSPMVTYASVSGVMGVQSEIVRNEVCKEIESYSTIGQAIEIKEDLEGHAKANVMLANPRGINNVDIYVPARGVAIFNTLTLKTGQKVSFSLASDKSSDSFSISVANSEGKGGRYTSSNGVVSGTYSISSNDDYKIFIDGYNYGGDDIHVTGMIRID